MSENEAVVEVKDNLIEARRQLEKLCDQRYVVDCVMVGSTITAGVLLGVSSTALILDQWDSRNHRPAGDPMVVELTSIIRIIVP
jgi:hypothetical protein